MAAAEPHQCTTDVDADTVSEGHNVPMPEDYDHENGDRGLDSSHTTSSMGDKQTKIGHRRVDKSGIVSYKKKPTSELMAAIQLGIGQSVGGLSSKPERDVLMQDFGVVEVVFFPSEGSNLTPAHHYSDFRFKTYAPVAFRYFRDLFGIQPDDFMLSQCDEHLKELSNPGASGSIFYLTQDDEFIIKTVQHKEADFLQKLLPGYFLNISQNKRTLLPKFYGLYCYQCGSKNIRFTVMNNLLPSTVKLHEKYDMKGSTYKRKASKHERSKGSPTLKDLDFMENHPDGLHLEKETYEALIKTLQRDCRLGDNPSSSVDTQSTHNTVQITDEGSSKGTMHVMGSNLQRGKSFKTRIGQYSTPMESIQGITELMEDEDGDVPPGGIPARNAKGQRLLLYLGIIDILQSFRLKKRLEHTVKAMVIDGDTISVHRPGYYAQRFLQYHAQRVFRKSPIALKHLPSKKRSMVNKAQGHPPTIPEQQNDSLTPQRLERSGRTISFSERRVTGGTGAVGGKPDVLPENSRLIGHVEHDNRSPSLRSDSVGYNKNNGNSHGVQKSSEEFHLNTYASEDTLSAGTASTASLRNVGLGYPAGSPRAGPSPPMSLSESTPTHTDYTEGTLSFTNSSPSCSSDFMDMGGSSAHLEIPLVDSAIGSPSSYHRSPEPHHHHHHHHTQKWHTSSHSSPGHKAGKSVSEEEEEEQSPMKGSPASRPPNFATSPPATPVVQVKVATKSPPPPAPEVVTESSPFTPSSVTLTATTTSSSTTTATMATAEKNAVVIITQTLPQRSSSQAAEMTRRLAEIAATAGETEVTHL